MMPGPVLRRERGGWRTGSMQHLEEVLVARPSVGHTRKLEEPSEPWALLYSVGSTKQAPNSSHKSFIRTWFVARFSSYFLTSSISSYGNGGVAGKRRLRVLLLLRLGAFKFVRCTVPFHLVMHNYCMCDEVWRVRHTLWHDQKLETCKSWSTTQSDN